MEQIKIRLENSWPGCGEYDIDVFSSGLVKKFDRVLNFAGSKPVVIVTNATVRSVLHAHGYEKLLAKDNVIIVPDSEQAKSFEVAFCVVKEIAGHVHRTAPYLVGIGGGVVGDLTGFVASIYRRGISFTQIPTTLLAQVDAAIGGKTALNTSFAKNAVGTFWHPDCVLCDVSVLKHLDQHEMACGMAEVIKYGVLDKNVFDFLTTQDLAQLVSGRDPKILSECVWLCAEIKARIVSEDEREKKGIRTFLNLGHTIGHAIEKALDISHGQAVSIGTVGAFKVAQKVNLLKEKDDVYKVTSMLKAIKLPTCLKLHNTSDFHKILRSLEFDKKFVQGKMRFVLPECIGSVCVVDEVPSNVVVEVIKALCS